ncbi:bifunctional glycosyltransferase 87/phosphatase PAP2 family protein [Streptomyces sp. AmelKG-E11A]|uniref:bifunctional glycosyltransferase 87/phosphatase PAP2 family protein n=1 Tax=Streptomyces sp. AmelKG-E11A TaxID=1100822 RepID=UPI00406C0BBD
MAKAEHGGPGDVLLARPGDTVNPRIGAMRVGLWLMAALLAVRQITVVLRQPPGERLTDLGTWTGPGGVLHVPGSLYDAAQFTGTPFNGLVLKPFASSAEQALGWGWTFGTLLLVAVLGLIVARAVPQPVSRRTALLAAPVAICLLMLSLPVRNTLHLGQTSIIPVLLVLVGCFAARDERVSGVLIGIGAAFQPTVLLFAPLLWFTGRRKAAVSAGATFAASTALAWAAMPDDSWTYWIDEAAGAGLAVNPDGLANQSLHGALLRFGLSGPLEWALFLALAAAVVYVGLRRAVRYARDGQLLLAVAITGCVAVAVSPTAWQHQLLWVLLAVVGRVGKRASDRPVWPVAVILAMTLPAKMMLPNMAVLHPVRDNVILVAALAAACFVPFLSRTAPTFDRPVPTDYAAPVAARWKWVPLVPFWRRVLTRPNLLLEMLLIRVGYSAYSQVRLAATAGRSTAEEHGRQIHSIEQALFIDIEHWVNHAVVGVPWLKDFFNFYYTSFHFVVPLTVLGVLYVRRPVDFRWARTALGFATVLALIGFWLYPLAPPRLMPGLGFIDTVHGAQDFSKPDYGTLTALTNQYAAMPSLHFGWSLWCGVVIVILAPKVWMKVLGALHPTITVMTIVGTANHWVLDAVGGAMVVGAGFGIGYLLAGPRARSVPVPPAAPDEPEKAAVREPDRSLT